MPAPAWQPWSPEAGALTPDLGPIIGHRGAAGTAPENTLAALREAHGLGCRWVEFDVMLSRDGVPVVIHDETIDRTTDGTGRVPLLTYDELRRRDAGVRFGPSFAGERIPHFEEAIELCLALGLAANVEIKPAAGHEAATGHIVAETLLRRWPSPGPGLLLSSFERSSLAAARATAPALPRGLLAEELPEDWESAMLELGCTTLHLDHSRTTEAQLINLASRAVPVLFYTVNESERARQLFATGAVAVFTDLPGNLLTELDQLLSPDR